MLFSEYLDRWLAVIKPSIEFNTYASYCGLVRSKINPYFITKKIKLTEIQTKDLQEFYTQQLSLVSACTVIHIHAVIHKALKMAAKTGMIPMNPAQYVERPKVNRYIGSFYDENELKHLFEIVKGDRIELAVLIGAYYGLRRSEVVGLLWNSIDFEKNTISVKHTVTHAYVDGKVVLIAKNRTKNKSSLRTLPLMPMFRERLLEIKQRQEDNRNLCGKSYNTTYLDYVLVDEMGNLITPNYITRRFELVLRNNKLRRIRYHDLRHSCASLLLANGVSMKEIQEWLGHSDFSTTANIYSHLDYSSKMSSAQTIANALS
jgi:integrase